MGETSSIYVFLDEYSYFVSLSVLWNLILLVFSYVCFPSSLLPIINTIPTNSET